MTWIKLRLPADREEQKQIHKMLRKQITRLTEENMLDSCIMTYHVKDSGSSFHLCMDIPELLKSSLNDLGRIAHMKTILDIVKPYISRQGGGVSPYFEDIVRDQTNLLFQYSVADWEISPENLASRLIDNASRGCKAALNILSNYLSSRLNPINLYDLVLEKCYPLNGGLWISDSAHFCFNSLGMSNIEEYAIRGYPIFSPINEMIKTASTAVERLLNREGLS